jgi:hypothetical protein
MWAYLGQAEAPTEPFPAIPVPKPGGVTEKTGIQPDVAGQPGPVAVPAAEPPPVPAQRPPADAQRPPADAQRPPADAQRPPADAQRFPSDAQRSPAGERPGQTEHEDENAASAKQGTGGPRETGGPEQKTAGAKQETASPERETASAKQETAGAKQETASRNEAPSRLKKGQASLGKPQLHDTKGLDRRPGESAPWAPVPPPATAPPKFAPPKSVSPKSASSRPAPPKSASPQQSPPAPRKPEPSQPPPKTPAPLPEPGLARRGRGLKVRVALALVLVLAGSLAFLLKRQSGTVQASAPTTAPSANAAPGTAAEARAAAAAWVASQVSRAGPISCDQAMYQALQARGVPAADLLLLKPGGGDPLRSRVIVVTAPVTKMVGTEFLADNAPAALASFGSGSTKVSVRVIYPRGAAAYAAALRQDLAERKTSEASLLENPRITAPPAVSLQLQGGQVDPRLLLTLAQLASQWPLSIVAFDDRAPGASSGVPLRSADLAVTGDAAGRAQQMSAYAHQLQGYFASARIRAVRLANGQNVVRVEFAAPSPLGVLNR